MASPVTASTRTVYTVEVGDRRRTFQTKRAAYYKAALWMLVERADGNPYTASMVGASTCSCIFCIGGEGRPCTGVQYDLEMLTSYARRVARKLRARDEYREKVRRG